MFVQRHRAVGQADRKTFTLLVFQPFNGAFIRHIAVGAGRAVEVEGAIGPANRMCIAALRGVGRLAADRIVSVSDVSRPLPPAEALAAEKLSSPDVSVKEMPLRLASTGVSLTPPMVAVRPAGARPAIGYAERETVGLACGCGFNGTVIRNVTVDAARAV